ncbi:uncharacterized protein THITE_152679 [Thermothielavioides terrestris NRRL 8126]|uniref:Cyanovirin-N domain-containing protein n=1 Tax=Thermothielavioides terrestris (strain ATCC 38088 / NRRL 8126) TaxID=578455 RepID=G2R2F1_THETT|nr:uncharacterized protein THITE_152679 [Thermothielavioides terrestris NRRL 8126]AEO65824.1 hypothetical protein THITE_152679 [Thermothielavioides terrestris NRRL 8126]
MRLLAQIVLFASSAILAAGWRRSANPPLNGTFADVCGYGGGRLTEGRWLGAYCRNNQVEVYNYTYTWIDLNLCVANNDGQLIAYNNGNYTSSCGNCTVFVQSKTLFLNCICWNSAKHYTNSSLDLSNYQPPSLSSLIPGR